MKFIEIFTFDLGIIYFLILWLVYVFLLPLISILFDFSVGKILFSKRKQLCNAGEWVIITGAGDGIGKAFAEELASDGHNIMLLGRTLSKLQNVAGELERKYGIKTKTIAVDFSQTNIYENIERQVNLLPSISCLINNVGMMTQTLEEYATEPVLTYEKIQELIHCNVVSTMCMTRMVLARLIQQDSGAAIINMGSAAASNCSAYLSAYSTTKITAHQLSRCLRAELSGTDIVIQNYEPFYIATNISEGLNQNFYIPTPKVYARSALDMLGVRKSTTGYFRHELLRYVLSFCPDWVVAFILKCLYRQMKSKVQ